MLRVCLALLLCGIAMSTRAADKPTPVWIDTDLGSEIDDALALALAVASPQLEIVGVTTVCDDTTLRAKMALRFLHATALPQIPVAAGPAPQPKSEITGQYQYYYHPAVLYNRAGKPQAVNAVDLLATTLKNRSEKLTIIALGPLTNLARLLSEHPDAKDKIERIVLMGGGLARDYEGRERHIAEWNIKTDIKAAQAVFSAGVPLVVVPVDATWNLRLEAAAQRQLFAKHSLLTMQVEALYQMWNQETPVLFDPVAVAAVVDSSLCKWKDLSLRVNDQGITEIDDKQRPNARVAIACDPDRFIAWYVQQVTDWGKTQLPTPPGNRTELIDDNAFPARVHVVEDYETDIEKRWWLAGRIEEKEVPSGSRRACRSQLTLDFDDLQGQLDTMYNAVVFNPVPGPPLGPSTRLKFRYRLEGTSTLRIQIYSLSNGYHRYLSLADLPQGKWQEATVDMTAARRPDGSGGKLSQDERIDDIQFYVDPRSSVLIDDIILYDAGEVAEQRPFPQRILFTGWFDTGKQGQEWPGTFQIVEHKKPDSWKFAQSVSNGDSQQPQLSVSLRGERKLTARAELRLRYRLTGKEAPVSVQLQHGDKASAFVAKLPESSLDTWHTATLTFPVASAPITIDRIAFVIPAGTTLSVDDLLLYQPSNSPTP